MSDINDAIDSAIAEIREMSPRHEITQDEIIGILERVRVRLNGTCKQDLQVGGER